MREKRWMLSRWVLPKVHCKTFLLKISPCWNIGRLQFWYEYFNTLIKSETLQLHWFVAPIWTIVLFVGFDLGFVGLIHMFNFCVSLFNVCGFFSLQFVCFFVYFLCFACFEFLWFCLFSFVCLRRQGPTRGWT